MSQLRELRHNESVVRTSITAVPLIGVLIALIAFALGDLASVDVQVPRRLDDSCDGYAEHVTTVRVYLHADSSAELDIDGQRRHVEASRLSAIIRAAVNADVEAVYMTPDENTSWQQVVDAISSLASASGVKVALSTRASG